MDIVGPLPTSSTFDSKHSFDARYLVTFIDRATRWCEAQAIPDIEAKTVATAFINQWISRFGVPLYLVTDRGRQFESELFSRLSEVVGFHRLRTSAYHPQSNGMIERVHRTIKTALKARGGQWLKDLPIVLLGLRAIPNESGASPFTTVTGTSLLVPSIQKSRLTDSDFIKELARTMKEVDYTALSEGRVHGPHQQHFPQQFNKSSHVWVRIDRVRRPLEAPYSGPYEVETWRDKTVIIKKEDGSLDTVSVDRIKPAILTASRKSPPRAQNHSAPPPAREESTPSPQIPPTTTKSGRRVTFPEKLKQYFH